ncbi:DNA polymerase epsilon subunit 4 isoform X1 [Salarias fasciatus]|uniref:DNA polymerase epsilon subunit 4 isoform X1 n=1 Tax=Salarias fasciatus TaxID=181472 RepID=UPI0011768B1C|nr:DNA polymerase epsilon subunit 4 isoform X1 [Salarias fasciatus]
MAAALATPITPVEHDPSRCVGEKESRGAAVAEDGSPRQKGPAAAAAGHHSRLSKLPLARIKALMKTDPDVSLASQESVFIIAKATIMQSRPSMSSLFLKAHWIKDCFNRPIATLNTCLYSEQFFIIGFQDTVGNRPLLFLDKLTNRMV